VKRAGAVVLLLAVSAPAGAASFDCARAASAVEKRICATPRLSALDEELAATYAQARRLVADPAALKAAQQAWIRAERDKEDDAGAIEAAYLARIEEIRLEPALKKALFARQAAPPSVPGRYSETEPLCLFVEEGHECQEGQGDVENYFDVKSGPGRALTVDSTLVFVNGHECSLKGQAEWVDGELRVPALEDSRCVLVLRFAGNDVVPDDPGNLCKWALCGMRGGYANIRLPRVTAPKGSGRRAR
jgi:uncharacterized protein YecT (DUF1311 family)